MSSVQDIINQVAKSMSLDPRGRVSRKWCEAYLETLDPEQVAETLGVVQSICDTVKLGGLEEHAAMRRKLRDDAKMMEEAAQ